MNIRPYAYRSSRINTKTSDQRSSPPETASEKKSVGANIPAMHGDQIFGTAGAAASAAHIDATAFMMGMYSAILRRTGMAPTPETAGETPQKTVARVTAKYDKSVAVRQAREKNAARSVDDLVHEIEGASAAPKVRPVAVPARKIRRDVRVHDSAGSLAGPLQRAVAAEANIEPHALAYKNTRRATPPPLDAASPEDADPSVQIARNTASRFERTLRRLNAGLEKNRHRPGTQWHGMRALRPEQRSVFDEPRALAEAQAMINAYHDIAVAMRPLRPAKVDSVADFRYLKSNACLREIQALPETPQKQSILRIVQNLRALNLAEIPESAADRFAGLQTAVKKQLVSPLRAAEYTAIELAADPRAELHGTPEKLPDALGALASSRLDFIPTIEALHALLPLVDKSPRLHGGIAELAAQIGKSTSYMLENSARAAVRFKNFKKTDSAQPLGAKAAAQALYHALTPLESQAVERHIPREVYPALANIARPHATVDEMIHGVTSLEAADAAVTSDPIIAGALASVRTKTQIEIARSFQPVAPKARIRKKSAPVT